MSGTLTRSRDPQFWHGRGISNFIGPGLPGLLEPLVDVEVPRLCHVLVVLLIAVEADERDAAKVAGAGEGLGDGAHVLTDQAALVRRQLMREATNGSGCGVHEGDALTTGELESERGEHHRPL